MRFFLITMLLSLYSFNGYCDSTQQDAINLSCAAQVTKLEEAQLQAGESTLRKQDLLSGALDLMVNPKKSMMASGSLKDSIAYARYLAYSSCVFQGATVNSEKFYSAIDKTNEVKIGNQIADIILKDKKSKDLNCAIYQPQKQFKDFNPLYSLCCLKLGSCAAKFIPTSAKGNNPTGVAR